MDKEKRAADWQIRPGQIVAHTTDGEAPSPDIGIEVGLYPGVSLYIGELARQTLFDAGVKVPAATAGWWLALEANGETVPLALTCQGPDGEEPFMLVRAIRTAIMRAQVQGGFASADAEAQWIKDCEAGVYDEPCGVTGYDDDADRDGQPDTPVQVSPRLRAQWDAFARSVGQAEAVMAALMDGAEPEPPIPDPARPLTAADLADAFGCFWNAALGEAARQQEGHAFASIMAEGFRAVAARLTEQAAT